MLSRGARFYDSSTLTRRFGVSSEISFRARSRKGRRWWFHVEKSKIRADYRQRCQRQRSTGSQFARLNSQKIRWYGLSFHVETVYSLDFVQSCNALRVWKDRKNVRSGTKNRRQISLRKFLQSRISACRFLNSTKLGILTRYLRAWDLFDRVTPIEIVRAERSRS